MERNRFEAVPATRAEEHGGVALVPVQRPGRRGPRPLGAYVVAADRVRFQPAVDVERLVLGAVAIAGVAAVLGSALRRRPAVGPVSMGPGGWLSVKGTTSRAPTLTARRSTGHRPWWARALRARRLVVER